MSRLWIRASPRLLAGSIGTLAAGIHSISNVPHCDYDDNCGVDFGTSHTLSNWSSTHARTPARIYEPKNAQEVVRVLQYHNQTKSKIRPVGTALSPNGIGLSDNYSNSSSLSIAHLDYIHVDPSRLQVTVGAGARVSSVLQELKKHKLTLQNFSSIQEQQMGGWTQVSAHGTGCRLSTVDQMICRMQLATPTEGLLTLSESSNPLLFQHAKVGLGLLGVVTELSLHCMPEMRLLEHTTVLDKDSISAEHYRRLEDYRHVRYMWLPHTDTVVSVVSNPTDDHAPTSTPTSAPTSSPPSASNSLPTEPLLSLARQLGLLNQVPPESQSSLSFSKLRDLLLDHDPLNVMHIKRVNTAEAEFWRRSQGSRVDDSTNILGFDCGGEQWVLEVCFSMGQLKQRTYKDISFVRRLLDVIDATDLPAPSPIEQRWTARSEAKMSPAYSSDPDEVFCWVGIIMYLPPGQTESDRACITKQFDRYTRLIEPLCREYDAHAHWAKIESPGRGQYCDRPSAPCPSTTSSTSTTTVAAVEGAAERARRAGLHNDDAESDEYHSHKSARLTSLKTRIAEKYPVKQFNTFRMALDPNNILSNDLMDCLLGSHTEGRSSSSK